MRCQTLFLLFSTADLFSELSESCGEISPMLPKVPELSFSHASVQFRESLHSLRSMSTAGRQALINANSSTPHEAARLGFRLGMLVICLLSWAGCRASRPTLPPIPLREMQEISPRRPEAEPLATHESGATAVSYSEAEAFAPPPAAKLPAAREPVSRPGEMTLAGAIDLALAANPDLVSASEQLAIADATLDRARAEFFPKLGLSEQYGVTNNPVAAFSFQLNQAKLSLMQDFNNPRVIDDFHTQLRIQHQVYAGGQRLQEKQAAQAGVSAAEFDIKAVHNQLVFRVAEAYYRLLQARDLVQVRREAVEQVAQHLQIVESRFRNETAVRSDVLTVQVRLAEVREALISANNQLELAWAVLQNVTGARLERRPLPAVIPEAPWSNHVDEAEVAVTEALGVRPELGALANQRQAAQDGVDAASASKRLRVDLIADYDLYTGDFRTGNDSFFTGLVFQLNLFDGGRTAADVSRAMARVREIAAREHRLVLDVELDVRRAYLQLTDSRERLEVTRQAIDQAQESLREIEVRYRGQTATITALVDAQVALSNAQVRRTNAQSDVEIARASLERAIGRLSRMVQS